MNILCRIILVEIEVRDNMICRFKEFGLLGLGLMFMTMLVGCGNDAETPVSPTASSTVTGTEGQTLKVTVPLLNSPIDGEEVSLSPTLVTTNATTKFVENVELSQQFQVSVVDGDIVCDVVVPQGSDGTTEFDVPEPLEFGESYQWRTRAVHSENEGEWSTFAEFSTLALPVSGNPDDPPVGDGSNISTVAELCAFAATVPFNALPENPVPYRDAIIAYSGNPNVGLHRRPNGNISHDIVALNFESGRQPHQIVDVVGASTGCCPTRSCFDQTESIEDGSVFVPVN